jgi:uncharacterized Ntn-hydrolase superfamily protein
MGTFSIVARDKKTGDFGIAISTAAPAVGALAPHAIPGVAAVSTQSFVSVELGRKAVRLAEIGLRIDLAIESLLKQDEHREYRQVAGVDNHTVYGFTGKNCIEWAGHIVGDSFAVAGNMLAGKEVVEAIASTYRELEDEVEFPLRLLKAIKAGEEAGGDKRGKQSAALLVVSKYNPRWEHNLRVDDHPNPIDELIRIYEVTKKTIREFEEKYGDLMKIIKL